MRPELEQIERIEQYLDGAMTLEDRTAFETQLANDDSLREAVRLQQDLREGLDRMHLGESVRNARKQYYRRSWIRRLGWGGGLAVFALSVGLLLLRQPTSLTVVPGLAAATHGELYTIDCRRDTILHTAHGAALTIARGSIDAGGKNAVCLEIKEAYTTTDMIRYGLLTQSNGQPLSSGGMISIEPAESSAALIVRPIRIALPTNRIEQHMQRYTGVRSDKGTINWTSPRPLADRSAAQQIAYGRQLFENCRSCHALGHVVTGSALAYIGQRRSEDWLYRFIRDNNELRASGDCYANYVFNSYNGTPMVLFPQLSRTDFRRLMDYIASESLLYDSNKVEDDARDFDSCRRYRQLAGVLEQNRAALIKDNGPRTRVIRRDGARNLPTDTSIVYTKTTPVVAEQHPAIYYQFTVESFGWYNVDALLKDLPGLEPSELRVQLPAAYARDVNVFLLLPGRKVLTEGGLLKGSRTEFGFLTDDGQIPLPDREQGYVFATGEYQGQPVFAIQPFITDRKQTIKLQPAPGTKEQIMERLSQLDLNRLSIRVDDTKNAVRIRSTDTALATIARFKPRNPTSCDCAPKQQATPAMVSELMQ